MRHLLDQSDQQLRTWMLEHDQQPYRAAQIRNWIFARRAESWDQMSDLPRGLREQLASEFDIWSTAIAVHRKDDDGTEKLLLTLADGRQDAEQSAAATGIATALPKGPLQIECVLLRDDKGHCSMCISTQVGCAMKCAFCATGLGGMTRNLTTGNFSDCSSLKSD